MRAGNLMIVQGGGPTAVFNASLASIISEGKRQDGIGRILGARSGVKGLAHGDIVDLSSTTADELKLLRNSPGAALGSLRYRPTDADLQSVIANLKRMEIRYLLFAGGNGTMRGAAVVSDLCRAAGIEVQIVGVPKTVDNDIAMTDRSPGYASAARYIAQATRELGLDLRSLPQPVTILETMGRGVGWIAGAASLARVAEEDAPHLVYIPEVPFYMEEFLFRLDQIVLRQGWAVTVVSEGIRKADGSLVYEMSDPAQLDPLKRPMTGGVGQYLAGVVGERLGVRCRSEKPGLLGRASMAHVSLQDQKDAELVGLAGVRALMEGKTDVMVALRPLADAGNFGCDLVPLSEVAGIERPIPGEWLDGGELAVNGDYRAYLAPLVGSLPLYCPAFAKVTHQEESFSHVKRS